MIMCLSLILGVVSTCICESPSSLSLTLNYYVLGGNIFHTYIFNNTSFRVCHLTHCDSHRPADIMTTALSTQDRVIFTFLPFSPPGLKTL